MNSARSIYSSDQWFYWLAAITATMLFLVRYGYWFNFGDQEEHLPQVYKMLDPDLYPNDYFMSKVSESFNIRFYYKWLVFSLSVIIGVPASCFLLTFLSLLLTSFSITKITTFFSTNPIAHFIAPSMLLIFFTNLALGNNSFQDNALICSTISVALCSLALLQWFREKYVLAVFFCGIASWFQVLEGLIMIALLLGLTLFCHKFNIKLLLKMAGIYLLCASPMLLPIFHSHFIASAPYTNNEYYNALYHIRNPNHYLPSYFLANEIRPFLAFSIIALASAVWARTTRWRFIISLIFITVSGMVAYYYMLERLNIQFVGKSQWFKSSVWLTLIFSICITVAISEMLSSIFSIQKLRKFFVYASFVSVFFAIPWVFASAWNPVGYFRIIYRVGNYEKTDIGKMHDWIRVNTPKEAVFLINPSNESFLCEAQRSLLIGYKAVIHEPFFIVPWASDFCRIYSINRENLNGKWAVKQAAINYESIFYAPLPYEKLDYRLDQISSCQYLKKLGPEVHREGDFILTQVIRK